EKVGARVETVVTAVQAAIGNRGRVLVLGAIGFATHGVAPVAGAFLDFRTRMQLLVIAVAAGVADGQIGTTTVAVAASGFLGRGIDVEDVVKAIGLVLD